MKKACLIFALFLSALFGFTQKADVKNIDLDIENNKVYINYDLIQQDTLSTNNIELFFIDDRFTVKVPEKLSGDIGSNVKPGLNKRIEWDIFKDDIEIAQKLKPRIVVNGIKKGGPKNALYSILVPGLGDYFVKDHRDMIIKPYFRTATILGLVATSIIASEKREKVDIYGWIDRYNPDNWWNETPDLVWDVKGYDYDYWLFKNDAEILLATGIAMWVIDVVWVFAKGTENERLKMFSNFSLNGYAQSGYTNLSLTYSF